MAKSRNGKTIGRPTKYRPEYCEDLIEQALEGKTRLHFCASKRIAWRTFYDWKERHAEFAEADEIADPLREVVWDDRAALCAIEGKGNPVMLKYYMSIRFGRSETSIVDNKSSDGSMSHKPTTVNIIGVAPDEEPETPPEG